MTLDGRRHERVTRGNLEKHLVVVDVYARTKQIEVPPEPRVLRDTVTERGQFGHRPLRGYDFQRRAGRDLTTKIRRECSGRV